MKKLTKSELDKQIDEMKKDLDFAFANNKPVIALSCVKSLEKLLLEKCNRCQLRKQVDEMMRGN